MNKKNIFLWTLYDFANSVVTIVFFLYFSQWLVVDKGVSDLWYNMTLTIGSALLLFTAPVLGGIADKTGQQQKYLNKITILTFLCFLSVSLSALFILDSVFWAVLLFILANYFYQFSFVFYNALLSYIAPKEKWGLVSGIGQSGNWLGEIAGLLITLPFASGALYLFGQVGRAQTFLPATILFFLLALPMLLFFKLPKQNIGDTKISIKEEYQNFWNQFKDLIKAPGMGMFLLAYFFFNDAIITASNNFPIYLENVFSVSDSIKSVILLGILVTAVIGAFVSGIITDKIGLKKSLMIVLGSWIILFPLLALASNFTVFVILCVLMGFLFGSIWTVTRAAMTALCPKDKLNFGFGFYTLAERVSTLVGPLVWGLTTTLLYSLGPVRYRMALIAMAVFVAIGIFILKDIKFEESR